MFSCIQHVSFPKKQLSQNWSACLRWKSCFLCWKISKPGDNAYHAAAQMAVTCVWLSTLKGQSAALSLTVVAAGHGNLRLKQQVSCWQYLDEIYSVETTLYLQVLT